MDTPTAPTKSIMDGQKKLYWLKTNDNHLVTVADKDIKKMHTLSLLLAHQKGNNSQTNPINASMITVQELQLLQEGLRTRTLDEFNTFYYGLAQEDGLSNTQLQYTCGNKKLCTFINATDKANALCLRALCAKNFLYQDTKKPLISALINAAMHCIDVKNATLTKINLGEKYRIQNTIAWSPNGKLIASITSERYPGLTVYNAHTGKSSWTKYNQMGSLLIFSHNSKNIIIDDHSSHNIIILHASTGHECSTINSRIDTEIGIGHISCIACSHDNTKIGVGFSTGIIKIFSIFTSDLMAMFKNEISIKALAFNDDDKKIFSVSGKMPLMSLGSVSTDEWDILQRTKVNVNNFFLNEEYEDLNVMAFNPDNTKIAYGTNHNLIIWDSTQNNLSIHPYRHRSKTNNRGITALAFSPDGKKIIFGTRADNNHNLILWDTLTKNPLDIFKKHSVTTVAFNHDGKKIITGCFCIRGNRPSIVTLPIDKDEINSTELHNYDCHHAWLLYQLCSTALHTKEMNLEENSLEHGIFITLPDTTQLFLKNVF